MLIRLGRWLRAAGYDTAIACEGQSDSELLEFAISEKRKLITRDTHFLKMGKGKEWVIWLKSVSVEECVHELGKKCPLNWLKNPFRRCLLCNSVLQDGVMSDHPSPPEEVLRHHRHFWCCRHCGKTYWLGSHTKQMLSRLTRWQNELSC